MSAWSLSYGLSTPEVSSSTSTLYGSHNLNYDNNGLINQIYVFIKKLIFINLRLIK